MASRGHAEHHASDGEAPVASAVTTVGRARGIGAVLLLCVVSAAVAATAAAFLLHRPIPDSLATPSGPTQVALTVEDLSDARQVDLTVQLGEETSVPAPATGTVTATNCTPGGTVTSGTSTLVLDKSPLINLHTDVPLWRDLEFGTQGDDVAALQRELARLGHAVTETGRFDWQTWNAWDDLVDSLDGDTDYGTLTRAQVVWIPGPEVTVATCPVGLGQTATTGEPLYLLPAPPLAASIKSTPTDLVPGARTLMIGDAPVEIDEHGRLTDAGRAALAATEEFAQYAQNPKEATLSGELTLLTPLQVYPVPPAAVAMTGETSGCIVLRSQNAGGKAVPVTVVASKLGRSYITFSDKPAADAVEARAERGLTCS